MKKLLMSVLCLGLFFAIGCGNKPADEVLVEEVAVVDNESKEQSDSATLFEQGKDALEKENNPSKAIELFNEVLKQEPDSAYIYGDIARAKVELGDLEGAIGDLTKAIELEKRKCYYQWRADVYLKLGNEEAAKADTAEMEKIEKE